MKQDKMGMVGLLEILAFKTECVYLSDLHEPERLGEIQYAARHISPRQFSLWEWSDAVAYITGERPDFQSVEDAVDYLACYSAKQAPGGASETPDR